MARKSIYTKRLGNDVAKGAKGSIGNYHVIPAQVHKWSVVAEGRVRPVKAFATRKDAVTFAKRVAGSGTGEIIIHSIDGTVQSKVTY